MSKKTNTNDDDDDERHNHKKHFNLGKTDHRIWRHYGYVNGIDY